MMGKVFDFSRPRRGNQRTIRERFVHACNMFIASTTKHLILTKFPYCSCTTCRMHSEKSRPTIPSLCHCKAAEKWELHRIGQCHPCVAFALKPGGCFKAAAWQSKSSTRIVQSLRREFLSDLFFHVFSVDIKMI